MLQIITYLVFLGMGVNIKDVWVATIQYFYKSERIDAEAIANPKNQ